MWRNAVVALLGLYFVVAPWWTGTANQPLPTVVSVAVGALLAGVFGLMVIGRHRQWMTASHWLGVLAGFWFVLHPFLGHFDVGPYWAYVAPAILVMVLNLWTLMKRTRVSQG